MGLNSRTRLEERENQVLTVSCLLIITHGPWHALSYPQKERVIMKRIFKGNKMCEPSPASPESPLPSVGIEQWSVSPTAELWLLAGALVPCHPRSSKRVTRVTEVVESVLQASRPQRTQRLVFPGLTQPQSLSPYKGSKSGLSRETDSTGGIYLYGYKEVFYKD